MSNPRKVSVIEKALSSKGFSEKEGGNHRKFIYHYKKKKTAIFTIISRGHKEYDMSLLSKMSKQLKLTNSELLELIDCPLTKIKYKNLLVKRGHIKK